MFVALINCPECQKRISDRAFSCPNCGYQLNIEYAPYKRPIPGRGFGIASMIMGIFALLYVFSVLRVVIQIQKIERNSVIVAVLVPFVFTVLSLVFGYVSHTRGYNKGIKKAGIIMGEIALAACLAIVISCV